MSPVESVECHGMMCVCILWDKLMDHPILLPHLSSHLTIFSFPTASHHSGLEPDWSLISPRPGSGFALSAPTTGRRWKGGASLLKGRAEVLSCTRRICRHQKRPVRTAEENHKPALMEAVLCQRLTVFRTTHPPLVLKGKSVTKEPRDHGSSRCQAPQIETVVTASQHLSLESNGVK